MSQFVQKDKDIDYQNNLITQIEMLHYYNKIKIPFVPFLFFSTSLQF